MINYYLKECLLSTQKNVSIDYLLFLSEESQEYIDGKNLKKWIEFVASFDPERAAQHEKMLITRLGEDNAQSYIPVYIENLDVVLNENFTTLGVQYLLEHYQNLQLSYETAIYIILERLEDANRSFVRTSQMSNLRMAIELFIESTSDVDSIKILYTLLQTREGLSFEHPALMFHVMKQKKYTEKDKAYINSVICLNPKPYVLYAQRKEINLKWLTNETMFRIAQEMPSFAHDILNIPPATWLGFVSVEPITINVDWLSHLYYDRIETVWTRMMNVQDSKEQALVEPYVQRFFNGENKKDVVYDFCGMMLNVDNFQTTFNDFIENQKLIAETISVPFSLSDSVNEFLSMARQNTLSEVEIHL